MKRLALLALILLTLVLPVQARPKAPRTGCTDGAVTVYSYTPDFGFGHQYPCGWVITLVDAGRVWGLAHTSRVPLALTPLNENCQINAVAPPTPIGGGYAQWVTITVLASPCVFDLRLPYDLPYFYYMWDTAQVGLQ